MNIHSSKKYLNQSLNVYNKRNRLIDYEKENQNSFIYVPPHKRQYESNYHSQPKPDKSTIQRFQSTFGSQKDHHQGSSHKQIVSPKFKIEEFKQQIPQLQQSSVEEISMLSQSSVSFRMNQVENKLQQKENTIVQLQEQISLMIENHQKEVKNLQQEKQSVIGQYKKQLELYSDELKVARNEISEYRQEISKLRRKQKSSQCHNCEFYQQELNKLQKSQQQFSDQIKKNEFYSSNNDKYQKFLGEELNFTVDQQQDLQEEVKSLKNQNKENSKFVKCLKELVMKCQPQSYKNQEPNLKEIWKFIKHVLGNYIEQKDANETIDVLCKYLVCQRNKICHQIAQLIVDNEILVRIAELVKDSLKINNGCNLQELERQIRKKLEQ